MVEGLVKESKPVACWLCKGLQSMRPPTFYHSWTFSWCNLRGVFTSCSICREKRNIYSGWWGADKEEQTVRVLQALPYELLAGAVLPWHFCCVSRTAHPPVKPPESPLWAEQSWGERGVDTAEQSKGPDLSACGAMPSACSKPRIFSSTTHSCTVLQTSQKNGDFSEIMKGRSRIGLRGGSREWALI